MPVDDDQLGLLDITFSSHQERHECLQKAALWLESLTAEYIDELPLSLDSLQIMYVAPGDVVYVPAGVLIVEKCINSMSSLRGLCLVALMTAPSSASPMCNCWGKRLSSQLFIRGRCHQC